MKKVHRLIKNRYSPRAFSEKEVSENDIKTLLEAASMAASSYNEQPWRFIYALKQDNAAFNKLLSCVMEFNLPWTKNVAGLIVCVTKDNLSLNDKPNFHAWHDMGLAVGNLTIQAQSMDIYLRQIGGFYADKAKEILNIPEGYTPTSVIALGYLGDIEDLPTDLQEKEKTPKQLKPIEDIIFSGSWK
jgi:nitroreductase